MMTMVKGGTELLQDPIAQELLTSRIPARLAYNWTDGTPRVVSIWFHWNGSDIVMATLPGAPKLKALQSGDRVAITIDTNDPPHHILSIRGTAEVTESQRALSGKATPACPSAPATAPGWSSAASTPTAALTTPPSSTSRDGCSATGSSPLTVVATGSCWAGWTVTGSWRRSGWKAPAATALA
jgi:hypothetical protein